ncbi:Cytochrome P450 3A2 [Talaromyces islandicus]|uniref:Cytochrome P450 3A2 n=1 Tax=Talaromyces islandicus TaxID=28573 RepID=A0A0U1M9Z7_TALIS|nr:Cytochrome P450 3A2 [Talaromyces islandicus]
MARGSCDDLAYAIARSVYLLYFHPASSFPGPKFAAVSYVTCCYQWMRGRYPWFLEEMHHKYGRAKHVFFVNRNTTDSLQGDVVRVGPNEIVFFTPQAATDIHTPAVKNQELFVKTDIMDFGAGDLGFIWEKDPAKRSVVAKKLLPAFSPKAIREKEPVVHTHMDRFVSKMKELGSAPEGLIMNDWLLWLSVDMGADLAYNREFHHLRDGKTSDFIETLRGTSFAGTLIQLSRKIAIIGLLAPFFVPLRILRTSTAIVKANAEAVKVRIQNRGKTSHPDFMDYMISPNQPEPSTKQELMHLEQVALQMFIAGFDPVQITFYASLFFLLKYPSTRAILTKEIRDSFSTYEEITPHALTNLKYLQAFIQETMRTHLTGANGMPRVSPGATADGIYVPKGVVCQLSTLTAMRHERYFRDPKEFHPERWLPHDHPLFNDRYANDNLKAYFPFSLGPRQCTGREIAWSQLRLFLG